MHAKHADEPNALTGLVSRVSKTAMALRAFVLAPVNFRLPTGGEIEVRERPASRNVTDYTANKSG